MIMLIPKHPAVYRYTNSSGASKATAESLSEHCLLANNQAPKVCSVDCTISTGTKSTTKKRGRQSTGFISTWSCPSPSIQQCPATPTVAMVHQNPLDGYTALTRQITALSIVPLEVKIKFWMYTYNRFGTSKDTVLWNRLYYDYSTHPCETQSMTAGPNFQECEECKA